MLRRYLASEAYMYCGETLYNIPWMLLYFSGKYISLWHVRVRKESWLHKFLRERKDLSLFPVISKEGKEILYLCVEKTGKWMDLRLDFVEHEQKYYFKDDSVKVTIAIRISRKLIRFFITAPYSITYPTFRTVRILLPASPSFCRSVLICISTVRDSPSNSVPHT